MQAQDPHYKLAGAALAVAAVVANLDAMVDEAATLLEDADKDMDAEDNIGLIHQDPPVAILITTPPKVA